MYSRRYLNNSSILEYTNIDKIDNSYYNTLYEISKLFKNKNFKSNIGAKANSNSISQIIIFYNPIN